MAPYIIIILLIAFVLFWIFRRYFKHKRLRNTISALLALISAVVLYFAVILTVYYIIETPKKVEFSQEIWQRDKAGRYEMCDIILDTHLLKGKTKQDVIHLLGTSPREDNETIYYPLDIDNQEAFTSGTEALVINFKEGVVTSVELQ